MRPKCSKCLGTIALEVILGEGRHYLEIRCVNCGKVELILYDTAD
jgi:hypothetical protein